MTDTDSRPTVLIVDDERGPRESLRMILEPGYRVLQCGRGSEALELLRRQRIDVVTLDLHMPGMRGDELMHAVRREFPSVELIVITGCGSIESAAEAVRQGICDYLQKPFDVVQVTAAVARAVSRRAARTSLTRFLEELGAVVGRDREAQAILDEVHASQKLRARLGELFDARGGRGGRGADAAPAARTFEFLEVLAETIETKDRFMRGHARRVAFYTGVVGERLGLGLPERASLRLSAFLHDLGKVGVPTDLLLRAGALEPGERRLVEQHPVIGARLLAPLDMPSEVSLALRHHHEWWDGSGYPDGIAGERIPLAARIIGVADAFDAMTCDRPYRRALGRETVLAELRRYAGTQFDPDVAAEFLACLESGLFDADPELLADAASGAASAPQAA
jgi:response regulator RpfG family c-di-GMP phosphodiesterase